MDAKTENSIREEQVESFGRLMAGLAHDMKNHLGIIRESNGLMDDIIEMGSFGEDSALPERLQRSIAAIERRVVISAKMMHHLSGLAHRPDNPHSSFLLNDLIEEEYVFLERFSRLKQIEVVFQFTEEIVAIYSDPSLLQHVFYRVYVACLKLIEEKQALHIITEQQGDKSVLLLRFPKPQQMKPDFIKDAILLAAILKLEGEIEIDENKEETIVKLLFSSMAI